MNFEQTTSSVKEGSQARRESWVPSKKIRMATTGDMDYINYDGLMGCIVCECHDAVCDVKIAIYNPSDDDKSAEDWVIM